MEEAKKAIAISELPVDELIVYGRELGLQLDAKMGQGELLRLVRERQQLLFELEHEAMLDVVVWARRPVRETASKEELAKEIAGIRRMNLEGLSHRGAFALARLRGVSAGEHQTVEELEALMRANESFWNRMQRRRRRVVGSIISRVVVGSEKHAAEAYRFLPDEKGVPTLKEHIVEEGVVGGIARRLRGVADDYVREKLDEIELRIDKKLDEIDRRLGEWRDREITNRLKIIKITLVASILVALLSLGYDYLKQYW